MKRSKRHRQTQNRPPEVEKDRLLMVILAIFNLGSGSTTIMGAQQILPKLLAWPLGAAVQLMLFLLLSGAVVKQAWLKKWIAVLVFTGLSVYTSFFTYYGYLAGKADDKQALDRAVQAHQRLVAEVYTPMKVRLTKLEGEAETLRVMAKQEKEIGLTTGEIGCGEKCRLFKQQAIKKENEVKQFASILEELRPKFEYDVEGLKPEEILNKDRQALAAVPASERNNYPDLARDLYIDTELDISLLAPYYKVKRGEESAVTSLAIAMLVDGMVILLGTAIIIRRPGNVEILRLRLQVKGSEFLRKFLNAINETEPHIIDYYVLKEDENYHGFKALIGKLKNPKVGWVQLNAPYRWEVTAEHYDDLTDWLYNEINRQSEEEEEREEAEKELEIEKENDDEWSGFTEKDEDENEDEVYDVKIRIPLNTNSN